MSIDETNDGKFSKNSLQFLILPNENNGKVNIDDDGGDLDLCRPEHIDLNLGIALVYFYSVGMKIMSAVYLNRKCYTL
jgi:hypothetical protein